MKTKNLWNDAAKYGAIVGLVSAAFDAIFLLTQSGLLLWFIALVVYVLLLYLFTKRRAALYGGGEEGFSYSRGLQFILCLSLFAGILIGAYQIIATNWLFAARYNEIFESSLENTIAALDKFGFYNRSQLDELVPMVKAFMYSPFYLIFAGVLNSLLKGLFFGLFVAAFTRRSPDIFAGNNE